MSQIHAEIPEPLHRFVREEVAAGRYGSESEVLSDALYRLLESQVSPEEKLKRLKAAIIEGLESGEAEPFEIERFLVRMHAEHHSKP